MTLKVKGYCVHTMLHPSTPRVHDGFLWSADTGFSCWTAQQALSRLRLGLVEEARLTFSVHPVSRITRASARNAPQGIALPSEQTKNRS